MAKKTFTDESLATFVEEIKSYSDTNLAGAKSYTDTEVAKKANSSHTHSIANVTNLQTSLDSKVPTTRTVNGKALSADITLSASDVGAATSGHTHSDYVNQNAFSNVKVGTTTVAADTTTDTLEIVAGTGISVSGDATNDKVTITNSGVRSIATGTSNGTISVNTNGASANVAVKGLGSAAYTASTAYDASGTAQTKADAALASAKSYTDGKISDLLDGADDTTLDSIKELADAIKTNDSAIDALNSVAAGKASASDLTSHTGNKSNPHGVTLAQLGVTATAAEVNKMDGVTATTAEINILDGITATTTELNYVDGVTSNIQTQLDGKAASSHTHTKSQITDFPTSLKNPNALTIQGNGTTLTNGTYDGSSAKTVNITPSSIGAATSGHTHSNYASTVTTTGTGNAITAISQSGNTITATKGSTFLTAHPTITKSDDTTSTASPSHGGTFTAVDSITRDSNGHVTKVNTKTITLPSDNNTDTKVTQAYSTGNASYPLLLSATSGVSSTSSRGATTSILNNSIYANPSTGTITAKTFSGALSGNASTATKATTADSASSVAWSGVTSKPSYYDAKAIKAITRSGTTFTYTCMDGTTGTFTQQDNNTTYTLSSFGITATATELNYCDGVTSNIQTQLDGKAATHSHPYLPLSGGTMTGNVIFSSSANGIYMGYNGTNYQVLTNGNNSNVIISACGGGLYLGYANTSNIYCRGNYVNIDSGNYTTYCAAASHSHYYAGSSSIGGAANSAITLANEIDPSHSDTVASCTALGTRVSFISNGTSKGYPTAYGMLFNMAYGSSECAQIYTAMPSGGLYIRSGNANGWSTSFARLLDSNNYSSYALPLSGGTMSGAIYMNSGCYISFKAVDSGGIGYMNGAGLFFGVNAIKPTTDNAYATGTSNYRWTNVYAVNGTIKTSDENEKDILESGITSDYENWYLNLKPILYKWKNFEWENQNHDRIHCGLGAQTTLAVAKENNLDEMSIAAICRDDLEEALPDGRTERYGIRYEELVSMNIHMIQKLYKKIEVLEAEIEELKTK